jgi:hypothetical protein
MTMTPIHSTLPNPRVVGADASSSADPQTASADVAGAPLLPEPAITPLDIGQAIAELVIDSAFAQRKNAREAKQKAEGAMEAAQKQELAEMRAAADEKYTAAQIEAWTQIATGAVTVGAIGLSAAGGGVGDAGSYVAEAMKDGGTDLGKGTGKLASSAQQHEADRSTAAAKEAEQAAGRMKTAVEDCADDVRATKESVRKALDFLKEFQAAESQTRAAALYRA